VANGRRAAVAGWLCEVSALVLVFPTIDQLAKPGALDWRIVAGSIIFACLALGAGLTLTKKHGS